MISRDRGEKEDFWGRGEVLQNLNPREGRGRSFQRWKGPLGYHKRDRLTNERRGAISTPGRRGNPPAVRKISSQLTTA